MKLVLCPICERDVDLNNYISHVAEHESVELTAVTESVATDIPEFDDEDDGDDDEIKIPKAVLADIAAAKKEYEEQMRAEEMRDDEKTAEQYLNFIEKLNYIETLLKRKNMDDLKFAQLYYSKLMSPLTNALPDSLIHFLAKPDLE